MRLGIVLRKYRLVSELTLRQLAEQIGIGFATLNRIENGKDCDAETLMKIFHWLTGTENVQAAGAAAEPAGAE